MVQIVDFTFDREPGVTIVGKFYLPLNLDPERTYPMVHLQHGMGGRQENMLAMALSFSSRGFIVSTMNLRNAYGSGGHTTLGNKEAEDLLAFIDAVKVGEFGGKLPVTIDRVGVVGHSLGSLTVTLAAIRGQLDSCVAIAPPANFTSLVGNLLGTGIPPIDKIGSFNNLFDSAFLSNITLMGQPRPPNILLIAGYEDWQVPEEVVAALFDEYTGVPNSPQYTTFGNFSQKTAHRLEIYHVRDHGAEQFSFDTPEITISAINWTEQALGLTNGSSAIILPEIMFTLKDIPPLWKQIGSSGFTCLFLGFIGLIIAAVRIIPQNNAEKTERGSIRNTIRRILKDPGFLVFNFGFFGGVAIGNLIPYPIAFPYLFPGLLLQILWPLAIGGTLGVLLKWILQKLMPSKFDPTSGFSPGLREILFALLFPLPILLLSGPGIAQYSNWIQQEFFIKPMPIIPGIWGAFAFFIGVGIWSLFLFQWNINSYCTTPREIRWVPLIIIPAWLAIAGILIGIFHPIGFFSFTLLDMSIPFWLVIALLTFVLGLAIELVNLPFRDRLKTDLFGSFGLYGFAAWLIFTTAMAF
jgi:pimeloyl-ACP methyl ester carboxylesterase